MNIQIGKDNNRGRKGVIRLFLSCMFTLVFSLIGHTVCFATTVTLQWGANTDSDLAGYKVYYQADSSSQPFGGTGATQGSAPVNVGNTTTTATISGLDPSHEYYFAVTAYNTSGVESSYSNVVSVPELVSPTISITSPANNATVSGTVSVTASASDNVGITKVEYYVNNTLQSTDTASPYVYSWNTAALSAGSYTLMTKAYDAAGNVGQSSSVAVTVANDTTAPTVSLTAPANGSTLSGTTTITAGASDNIGVSSVEFYANGTLLSATNVSPYSYSWNTKSVANGSYTLVARAYDASGNVGQSGSVSVTITNDTTAPTVSLTAPANGSTLSGTSTITSSASDNVGVTKVEFYSNGTLLSTASASPYSYSWNTKSVANGSYTLVAKAYDAAGNIGQSASVSVTVFNDTAAPEINVFSLPSTSTALTVVISSLSASDAVGVTGYLITESSTAPSSTDSGWSVSVPTSITFSSEGTKTAYAWAKDAAGNVSSSRSASVTITLPDKPTISVISPASGATVGGTVAITASASDNVGVTKVAFYVNGYLKSTDTTSPYIYSWNTKALTNGTYTIMVKAYDASGNVTSTSIPVTVFNDKTAPTVSITSPASSAKLSDTVTINAVSGDNVGVTKLELFVNGVLKVSQADSNCSYNWNTKDVSNGTYSIRAKAYDAAGNVKSTSISVRVFNDTTAPLVSITSPYINAKVNGTVSVSANAWDNVSVTRVEFYVNGSLQASEKASNLKYTWNTKNVANGSNIIMAKAYDKVGNVRSISRLVTVNNL